MQITTISDTHGLHHQLQLTGGDLLIHAGDVCNRGTQEEVINFINWFINQEYTYKVFIVGNHDFYFEHFTQLEIQEKLPNNTFYLNDSGVEIEGVKIWGSPITPHFFNLAFNKDRGESISKHWELIPPDTDILITHGPVFGKLDKTTHGENVGCVDLWNSIQKIKPKVHICGHIHEAYGQINTSTTQFFNASVLDEKYKLKNVPLIFDM